MDKKMTLKVLLSKLNNLDSKIKRIVNVHDIWRIPKADEKLSKLYEQVLDMVPEFSAIGYKLNPLSRKVSEINA